MCMLKARIEILHEAEACASPCTIMCWEYDMILYVFAMYLQRGCTRQAFCLIWQNSSHVLIQQSSFWDSSWQSGLIQNGSLLSQFLNELWKLLSFNSDSFMKQSFTKPPQSPSPSGEDCHPIRRQSITSCQECVFISFHSSRIRNEIVLLKVFRILAKYQAIPRSPYANLSWWVNYNLLLFMGGISLLCSWRVWNGRFWLHAENPLTVSTLKLTYYRQLGIRTHNGPDRLGLICCNLTVL